MPAAVPHFDVALNNATLRLFWRIADRGGGGRWRRTALRNGLNIWRGRVSIRPSPALSVCR